MCCVVQSRLETATEWNTVHTTDFSEDDDFIILRRTHDNDDDDNEDAGKDEFGEMEDYQEEDEGDESDRDTAGLFVTNKAEFYVHTDYIGRVHVRRMVCYL